jgi:hypothetical protein
MVNLLAQLNYGTRLHVLFDFVNWFWRAVPMHVSVFLGLGHVGVFPPYFPLYMYLYCVFHCFLY